MNLKITKKEIFTVPNLLSFLRLTLIPFLVWIYVVRQNYTLTVILVIISGITDIIDGFIARTFNMVSNVGKVLDPVADKLTQVSLMFCLTVRYPLLWVPIIIFIIKESFMLIFGYITLELTDKINSARWYGKVNTATLYLSMSMLIFFPDIPADYASFLIGFCVAVMLVTLVLYFGFYINILTYINLFHPQKNLSVSEAFSVSGCSLTFLLPLESSFMKD